MPRESPSRSRPSSFAWSGSSGSMPLPGGRRHGSAPGRVVPRRGRGNRSGELRPLHRAGSQGGGGGGLGGRSPRAAPPSRRCALGPASPRAGMDPGPPSLGLVPLEGGAGGSGGDPDARRRRGRPVFLPAGLALPLVGTVLRRQSLGDRAGAPGDRSRGPGMGGAVISPLGKQEGAPV